MTKHYIISQRWFSNLEPELGLGSITDINQRTITLEFKAVGETRTYSHDNNLIRAKFHSGETILLKDNQTAVIVNRQKDQHLFSYEIEINGHKKIIHEQDLSEFNQLNYVKKRLLNNIFDDMAAFELRYLCNYYSVKAMQSPLYGCQGARVDILPHQLHIIYSLAANHHPRIMLADEVGLGKTIEAGLILRKRMLNYLSQNALIVVPKQLCTQWIIEFQRRFNMALSYFDQERIENIDGENPFATEQLILISHELLLNNEQLQQQCLAIDWDMLIIDEAHHIISSHQQNDFIPLLAKQSQGLLLLTATPEQQGLQQYFHCLQLIDPLRFNDFNQFQQQQYQYHLIASVIHQIMKHEKITPEDFDQILTIAKTEELTIYQADPKNYADPLTLAQYLLNYHGISNYVYRNTRQNVKGFPEKTLHAEIINGQDDKLAWLVKTIESLGNDKILLICQDIHTAKSLNDTLNEQYRIPCNVFHEQLSLIQRDRIAAQFSMANSSTQLLICSEIGSEGRNFQFCQHLILYDLPENSDLLAQRIGRLDRIGQQHHIHIYVGIIKNSREEIFYKLYHEVFNAFLEYDPSILAVLAELDFTQDLTDILQLAKEKHLHYQATIQQAKDQLLEFNLLSNVDVPHLQLIIKQLDNDKNLIPFCHRLLEYYGIEFDMIDDKIAKIHPRDDLKVDYFPGIKEQEQFACFDRKLALLREDLQFLSFEHKIIKEGMELVLNSALGNAVIGELPAGTHSTLKSGELLLEAIFLIRLSYPKELQLHQFLPQKPLRILLDHRHNNLAEKISLEKINAEVIDHQQSDTQPILQHFHDDISQLIKIAQAQADGLIAEISHDFTQQIQQQFLQENKHLLKLHSISPTPQLEEKINALKNLTEQRLAFAHHITLALDALRLLIVA